MVTGHPCLTIRAEQQRDVYIIGLEGELDLSGCADLESVLAKAGRTRAARIILDLEELTYIDSSGLEVLVDASRRRAGNGARLQITGGKGQPADMFRLTALDRKLPLTPPALCPKIRGIDSPAARGAEVVTS